LPGLKSGRGCRYRRSKAPQHEPPGFTPLALENCDSNCLAPKSR
jgi:hypothetical protein